MLSPIRSLSCTLPLFAGMLLTPALSQTAPSAAPDGSTRSTVPGVSVYPYPNAPFSGSDTIQWVRPGNDGSTVTKYVTARIARDSQGRVYRERHHFAPAGVDPATTRYEFSIADPVAHTTTVCSVVARRCVNGPWRPSGPARLQPAGILDGGKRSLTRDALGSQTINGLPVEGSRETMIVEPGVDGNDKRLIFTKEIWYSPDLKTNLLVLRNDPREGNVKVALQVDSRSEPDASYFTVPAGYAVIAVRPAQAAAPSTGTQTDLLACPPERIDCQYHAK